MSTNVTGIPSQVMQQLPQVRKGVREVIRDASRIATRAAMGRRVATAGAQKAIELRLLPLVPLIITASALLYHQGMQSTDPHGGDKTAWKRILKESALGYAITEWTSGVFPLWGIGLSAFRAGEKPNVLEKLQAVVNTAVPMILGFLGVNLFAGMSDAAHEIEDHLLHRHLSAGQLDDWIQQLAGGQAEQQQLAHALRQLAEKLKIQSQFQGAKASWKMMKPLRDEVDVLKQAVFHQLQQLPDDLVKPGNAQTTKLYQAFRTVLADSQDATTRLARSLNPVVGYILLGLLGGTLVAGLINRELAQRFPSLKQKHIPAFFSSKVTMMPPAAGNKGHGGGHATAAPSVTTDFPGLGGGAAH